MNLTSVLCVLCALTSVKTEVYPGMPNQHVPNYINYLEYVNIMHHRPDKYPEMPYYGNRFDNHGSYKFNPHVIPICKTRNQFVCCQTKYTYNCQFKSEAQVSSVTVPISTTPKSTFTSTVLPVTTYDTNTIVSTTSAALPITTTIDTTPTSKSTSPIYTARETSSTVPSRPSTDSSTFVPTTEDIIENVDESTITSTVTKSTTVTSATSNLNSEDNGTTDSTLNGSYLDISTTPLPVSDSTSAPSTVIAVGAPTTVATTLTTLPTLPKSTIASFLTTTDINSGETIDEATSDSSVLITTTVLPEFVSTKLITTVTVDPDMQTTGSGQTTNIENGEESVTTSFSDVFTTTIMSPFTETGVSSPIPTISTDPIIDISSTSSEATVTFVRTTLPTVTTDITGSGIGGIDPDMETSGSGEPTDMGSGNDEILTEYEGTLISNPTVTSDTSVLTTVTLSYTTETSVSSTTPIADTEDIIDIDETPGSELTTVTLVHTTFPIVTTDITGSGIGGADPDMEASGSGEVTDMESGDDEITTEYKGSGIPGSSVSTSISVLTTATMNSITETIVSSTTSIVDTEDTIDIDENPSSELTTDTFAPTTFLTITNAFTGGGVGGADSDMEASGNGESTDMESGDDEITTVYEGSGIPGSSVTTSISVLTTATITSTETSTFNPATEEIIDIDGPTSSELTTVSLNPTTFPTVTTDIAGSGISATDSDLERSGEPTDMESGDDELTTRPEDNGSTIIAFTTEASNASFSPTFGTEKIISSLWTEPAVSEFVSTSLPMNDTEIVSTTVIFDVSTGFIDMEDSRDTIDPDMEGSGYRSGDGSGDGSFVSGNPITISSVKNMQLPNEV